VRLALDAMGGDLAPAAVVEGALLFAGAEPAVTVILVGDGPRVRAHLPLRPPPNVELHPASQVVEMSEHALAAVRSKRDASVRVAFELARRGQADAVVTAGHSGAAMAAALAVLGRLPGVDRPALAALFPALGASGRCLLLDVGANAECRASHLAQFAVLGAAYVRACHGVAAPRVALLSNGEEESKGTPLTREALALLRRSDLDFRGYAEGKDLFSGELDVLVTDGFTGNAVLKASEGVAAGLTGLLQQAVDRAHLPARLGGLLLRSTLAGLRRLVDASEVGGVPLLGIRGVGIVAHGRSSPRAVASALRVARRTVEADLEGGLSAALARARSWLPTRAVKGPKGKTPGPI
jgi:glycerol-3-phosphate acyltransferase PlsX